MSGPIVRKYGFPNFDKIFGERPLSTDRREETDESPPKKTPAKNKRRAKKKRESKNGQGRLVHGSTRGSGLRSSRRMGFHLRISLSSAASRTPDRASRSTARGRFALSYSRPSESPERSDCVRSRDQVGAAADFQAFIGPVFDASL